MDCSLTVRRIIAFFAEREKRGCDFASKQFGGCQLRFCAAYFSSFTIRGDFCARSGCFGETSANSVSVICRKVSESVGEVTDDFRRFPTLFQRDNFYFLRVCASFPSTSAVHRAAVSGRLATPPGGRGFLPPGPGVFYP